MISHCTHECYNFYLYNLINETILQCSYLRRTTTKKIFLRQILHTFLHFQNGSNINCLLFIIFVFHQSAKFTLLIIFSQALGPYKKEQLNITREQPSLVQSIKIDNWTIYRCINCNNMVYGSANDGSDIDKNNIVINSKLRKTHDEITKLRKSDDYSPLFKIVIKKMANSEASIAVEGKDSGRTILAKNIF